MIHLWLYSLIEISDGHIQAANSFGFDLVGPGFLNCINTFYGYQVWK